MTEILSPEKLQEDYQRVANLDPLSLDAVMTRIPSLNTRGDVEALVAITNQAVSNVKFDALSRFDSLAALRDLDFLLSSVVRHDPTATSRIHGLDDMLTSLAVNADSVPRGTVYTYAIANPQGARRRTFTGTPEEESFIEAVANGTIALDNALVEMANSAGGSDAQMVAALLKTTESLDVMIESILSVRKVISPQFFTDEMRPYFEPLRVAGKKYTGAGGAQLQLVALDFMLWGYDDDDEIYREYLVENWQYLTPAQKSAAEVFVQRQQGSLLNDILSHPEGETSDILNPTIEVLRKLRKFRYPHRKVAQDNFKIRADDAVGSGAYNTSILDVLIEKTESAMKRLEDNKHED